MKKKNLEELKTKSVSQLMEFISTLEKEIITGKIERDQSKVKNVHAINQKRKDIARAKTIVKAKMFALETEKGAIKNAAN